MIRLNEELADSEPVTLATIEKFTQTFSERHAALSATVSELQSELEIVRKKYLPQIRHQVATTAVAETLLRTVITGAPELFAKPRTQIFHGVKVGFQKGKGGIIFDDPEKVVALIRKVYGKDADAFIRTTEAPDKKMLADMPVSELKKIGCSVADTCDEVVVKPIDGDVEKIVSALLKNAVESEVAA